MRRKVRERQAELCLLGVAAAFWLVLWGLSLAEGELQAAETGLSAQAAQAVAQDGEDLAEASLSPAEPAVSQAPLDLNCASAEELDCLPGIGPVLAGRIVEYRTEKGAFSSVEELMEVKGIGEKRLAALEGLVTVDGGKVE